MNESTSMWNHLQELNWIDQVGLGVLLVFFVLGFVKGLIWQISRVLILLMAYFLSGNYGQALGDWIAKPNEVGAAAVPASPTTLYVAYVLLFVGALIVLSIAAMFLQKLAHQAGLGFFDRLGGGVVGVATGGCAMLFALGVTMMFFRETPLAESVRTSRSMVIAQRAVSTLDARVPDDLRAVYNLPPLQEPAELAPRAPNQGEPVEATAGRR